MNKKRICYPRTTYSQENSWVPVVSANTVRRILQENGLWEEVVKADKKRVDPVSRTAEEPGQSLNIDLCFVPAEHLLEEKLPAVSLWFRLNKR